MIYLELFITFLKIGAFTFGGGYAMIPIIQGEVQKQGWMTMEEFINFIAVSESTPGPLAINMATHVGLETGGIFGAFCATMGIVLPSFMIILLVAKWFLAFKNNKTVEAAMSGLRPAVIGLIGSAVLSVANTVFFPNGMTLEWIQGVPFWTAVGMFGLMVFLEIKKCSPIVVIVLSAVLGVVAGYAGLLG